MHPSRRLLGQQADKVEAVLASLSLPSHIQGGEVKRGWIRVDSGKIGTCASGLAWTLLLYHLKWER